MTRSGELPTPEPIAPAGQAVDGLSAQQVDERVRLGQVNDVGSAPTRSVGDIVRANVLTRFNLLIGVLLAIILVVAPIQDALFGLVAITNTMIGIIQEIRAKRTLDRLAVISAPRARVVRDGHVQEVDVEGIVLDDVVVIGAGEQLVVDGEVVDSNGLELNESLVTGESDPVVKRTGDLVLAGSFVAAGTGRARAVRVGSESFAGRLTEQARQFTVVNSELRNGIDRILVGVTWILVPTALLLLVSQLLQAQNVRHALASSVAGTIAMVPEGLVLLTSVAFAAAVIRLGQQNVLVRELPAVETLARVDVVCFDKTGTLTSGDVRVQEAQPLAGAQDVDEALGALAASEPEPNATLRAIATAFPRPLGWVSGGAVPFSSARKWSAASFGERGTWVLGAPEALLGALGDGHDVRGYVEQAISTGQRVVLLARSPGRLTGQELPSRLEPQALVVLAEDVRDQAADTVTFFHEQGVRTLLISGDHPRTVASVGRRVGVPNVDRPVTAADLPEGRGELADLLERRNVFGRVTPDDKRAMVRALQDHEHVVAMTGDGVNDVLALKDADIGIAMGNGAPATRSVAQLVLLDSNFATLPHIVAEGRRVIANIQRVANLFVTKTVYATLLAIAIGIARLDFPFLPRHLSLIGGLTIGVPAFFLALEPARRRAQPGFVRRTLAFAVPTGTAAAVATFAAYWLAQTVPSVSLEQARTTATITLFGLGVIVLRLLCRPMNRLRRTLVYGSVITFLFTLLLPGTRTFFALDLPPIIVLLAAVGIVAIAAVVMETTANALEIGQRLVRDRPTVIARLKESAREWRHRLTRLTARMGRGGGDDRRPE